MITKISTIAFSGINVIDIEAQIHFSKGQPGLTIVGLGGKAVAESKERIRSVLSSIGLVLPISRITVNLAPANIQKEGSHYDLPIALGILELMNIIPSGCLQNYIILGELSLDGTINHANGVLPAALHANKNNNGIICPYINGIEAAWAGESLNILAAKNIINLIEYFKTNTKIERPVITNTQFIGESEKDLSEVDGQLQAKRALEIAAAGGHNILMIGPPGTGKSMLASRINTILPPLNNNEMLEVSMIHSVSGLIKDGILSSVRPFRSPHHSASLPSIVGGGKDARPGEITIAHRGVLFLDELPEYPRFILETLRQPIEEGKIAIARAMSRVIYPANFQFVGAMNPCKCGYYGDKFKECSCSSDSISKYQSKISGPLMDRIDIHIKMDSEKHKFSYNEEKILDNINENSATIRNRVIKVRKIQTERYKKYENILLNSELEGDLLKKYCMPKTKEAIDSLNKITEHLQVSMRGISKILKVARTIADLQESENVEKIHILEAATMRPANIFNN